MNEIDKLKAKLRAKKEREIPIQQKMGLSTGSTLLNLACSGDPTWGLMKGGYYFLVGDSASGKTWVSLTLFAEATLNKRFKNYRLIFDNAENGALMDIGKYFGRAVQERMEPPARVDGNGVPSFSSTVEEFYYHVDSAFNQGSPFIYVLDSMDSLATEEEIGKFGESKAAHEKGKEISGSYGTSKAKLNSSYLRVVYNRLRETGSILLVISQTRDNIGFGAQFNPKTRGGGHALTFYAALEMWTSIKSHIKKNVRGKPREQGIICRVRVKKNRLTGRDRTVDIPIYHSLGIDEVGSMINWLVEEAYWKESKGRIEAPEFGFSGPVEKLITILESDNRVGELRELVTRVWGEIEEACEIKRVRRYK